MISFASFRRPGKPAEELKGERDRKALFDAPYYVRQHPPARWSAISLLRHYISRGWREGIKPNPLFDPSWYLAEYPDVSATGMEPFLHYLSYGENEGRQPSLLFEPAWYRTVYGSSIPKNMSVMQHYLNVGWKIKNNPHALFDVSFYLEEYPDVFKSNLEPLSHYYEYGIKEQRRPHRLFDVDWYSRNLHEILPPNQNAFFHYLKNGWRTNMDPSPHFDVKYYLSANPDVAQSGMEPLTHYVKHGILEGRHPKAPRPLLSRVQEPSRSGRAPALDTPHQATAANHSSMEAALVARQLFTLMDSNNPYVATLVPRDVVGDGFKAVTADRVRFIDRMLSIHIRIYVAVSADIQDLRIVDMENGRWGVNLPDLPEFDPILRKIFDRSLLIYAHTLQSLDNGCCDRVLIHRRKKLFVDIQESAQVDSAFSCDDKLSRMSDLEAKYLRRSDGLVMASTQAAVYFSQKYEAGLARCYAIPHLPPPSPYNMTSEGRRPTVVYIDDFQSQKCIPEMIHAMRITASRFDFRIHALNRKSIESKLLKSGIAVDGLHVSLFNNDTETIRESVSCSEYGFALMYDGLSSRLSLPTNLVDYISGGVIPILFSRDIGDFTNSGLSYVFYDDFIDGNLPTINERAKMAGVNAYILRNLKTRKSRSQALLFRDMFGATGGAGMWIDDELGEKCVF